MTSLNTISRAVSWDSAPLIRTGAVSEGGEHALDRVRGAYVIPGLGGSARRESRRRSGARRGPSPGRHPAGTRQVTACSYLAPYFSANIAIAVSAVARSGAVQISRRSALAAG